jgi:hypothetical protein
LPVVFHLTGKRKRAMHRVSGSKLLVAALAAGLVAQGFAATCEKTSPRYTAAVIELYTSEGCSSCPPADRWLSGVSSQRGREGVVPLGFHVDYWDYIGWKDEYAKSVYSQRQHQVASWSKSTFVYTPQVVLNGRDYRDWYGGGMNRDLSQLKASPARADLRISLDAGGNGLVTRVEASVPDPAHRAGAALYLALTQDNIVTPVKAGENSGVTLRHDHVVREWLGPIALDADGKAVLVRTLSLPKGAKLTDLGVSAIVQKPDSGDVLQPLALPACKG